MFIEDLKIYSIYIYIVYYHFIGSVLVLCHKVESNLILAFKCKDSEMTMQLVECNKLRKIV